jgi:MFS family permease
LITDTQIEPSNLMADYNLGYVWLISVIAVMGGLLFGWDLVVIGGAKPFFQRYFQLTTEGQFDWANSCALIGFLAGAMAAGALSDKFGRKRLLDAAAMIFAVISWAPRLANVFASDAVTAIPNLYRLPPQLPHDGLQQDGPNYKYFIGPSDL